MSLNVLYAGVVMLALTSYVLLSGADFGAGVWELPGLGQSKPSIGTRYVPA